MKKVFVIVMMFVIIPCTAFAEMESYYSYLGIGVSDVKYPDPLNDIMDDAESLPGNDRTTICLDFLGFYWPLNKTTMAGFIINGVSDTIDSGSESISFYQYMYSASIMKFFGEEIGQGFFIRGDIGFSKAVVSVDGSDYDDSASSDTGNGLLLGIGYGIPVSKGARILMGINVANRIIENDNYLTSTASVGVLW